MKIYTKEKLQLNTKIKFIKTNRYLVTCCLWADFKNGLKLFILLKIDKYSPEREHCGLLEM